ncbi:hypothetical protein N9L68_02975 [bacterium]|nr:hypothetical protein [bacterium]
MAEDVAEEPPNPRRGRPKGSKNKPNVQAVNLEEEEEPLELIPEATPEPPPPPKPKRQAIARARAPPPAPPAPAHTYIAAFMRTALRHQQQER